MVRIELAAADSLAAIRARSKLGIAIAAMIKMIATTISNSINEKPFCFRISRFLSCVCPLLRAAGHRYSGTSHTKLCGYLSPQVHAPKWCFFNATANFRDCLLYTSDAADERSSVDLGGRR